MKTEMITQINGNALEVLKDLQPNHFQTCVTSPPYYALRNYEIGGQIGLENSVDEYITSLVDVFAQVWRVMCADGILWVNIADSYAGSGKGRNKGGGYSSKSGKIQQKNKGSVIGHQPATSIKDAPAKSRIAIPERFVLAMINAGWTYRQEIIWAKSAPMPESVKDRPTTAHEKIFMFTKQKSYYSDMPALAEPSKYSGKVETRNVWSVWTLKNNRIKSKHIAPFPKDLARRCILASTKPDDEVLDPFSGSGTTGIVAASMGRKATLIDLNPDYIAEAQDKIDSMQKEF